MRNYLWLNCIFLMVYGRPDIIEEEVLDEILYSYNKLARPATDEEPTVVVKHGINLIKIEECDGETLKALTWLPISWTDSRLAWSLDFYSINSLTLPSNLLWVPDIVLYNSPSSHAGNAYDPRVYIFNTGSLSWYPPTHLTTNCEASDLDEDTVFCLMNFGSWSYDGTALDIQLSSDYVDTEDYIENSEWEYVNSTATRNVKKYACCPEPYPYVTYNITLRRREKPVENNAKTETLLPEYLNGVIQSGNTTYTIDPENLNVNTKPGIKKNKEKNMKPQRKTADISKGNTNKDGMETPGT